METAKLDLLKRAMTTYEWRMQALASNVANLDTPGYKRMAVSFEDKLQEAMHAVDSPRALAAVEPSMEVEERPPVLEDEMMDLADTQMRVHLSTRALREHYDLMRTSITGRAG